MFIGREVVVTEKMDGECTTIYKGGCHARSIDTSSHPSRERVKALAGQLAYRLPDDWRIVGENVYAQHSIAYDALPAHFLAFGLHVGDGLVTSWDQLMSHCVIKMQLCPVPTLYRGIWDEEKVRSCWTGRSMFGDTQEGYVVRLADAFMFDLFPKCVAKYVRADHVQTDEHWMHKPVVPNKLKRR